MATNEPARTGQLPVEPADETETHDVPASLPEDVDIVTEDDGGGAAGGSSGGSGGGSGMPGHPDAAR